MNSNYFNCIVNNLKFEEILLLGILQDEDSTSPFKSMNRSDVYQKSNMTIANFRKTLNNLVSMNFISILSGNKNHKIFITQYGLMALKKSLEEANS